MKNTHPILYSRWIKYSKPIYDQLHEKKHIKQTR